MLTGASFFLLFQKVMTEPQQLVFCDYMQSPIDESIFVSDEHSADEDAPRHLESLNIH